MNRRDNKIDWSEGYWKDMLIGPRKYIWAEDTIKKLAGWLELQPGQTVVDVGCGLGYLGYAYWPWYGTGGTYVGVDVSIKLLQDARRAATNWAQNGSTLFLGGDAYNLPLGDNFADVAICQTLLMHLQNPEDAVKEMIRIAKPGGVIVCLEPDNVLPRLGPSFMSLPQLSMEDQFLFAKIVLLCNKGRIKLGRGDASIGAKLVHLMTGLSLVDIQARLNDRVFWLEPPYDTSRQQHALEQMKKRTFDANIRKIRIAREQEEYLAGGGTPAEFDRYREIEAGYLPIFQQQIEAGEYYACGSVDSYIVKGRKPA